MSETLRSDLFTRLVLQLDGNSHVVYEEEEAAGTRLLIDGRTCLLQVGNMILILDNATAMYVRATHICLLDSLSFHSTNWTNVCYAE